MSTKYAVKLKRTVLKTFLKKQSIFYSFDQYSAPSLMK